MTATLLALALLAAGVAGDDASSASCRDDAGADAFKADSLVQLVAQNNRTRSGRVCREALTEDVERVCGKDGWYNCPGAADRLFFSKNSFHTNPCGSTVDGKQTETQPKGTDFKAQQQFMMQVAKSVCSKGTSLYNNVGGISLYLDFADRNASDIVQAYNVANSLDKDGKDKHGNKVSWDDTTTKKVNDVLTDALQSASLFVWIAGSEGPYTHAEVKDRPRAAESTAIDPSLISALVSQGDYLGVAKKLVTCATTPTSDDCTP